MKSSVSEESRIRSGTSAPIGDGISNDSIGPDLAQRKSLQIWLWMGLVLPLLSMLPLLYEQAKGIFAQRSYLFFPLSTLIGAWLLYRTCDYRPASLRRGRIAVGFACFGMGLAVLGICFFSPFFRV